MKTLKRLFFSCTLGLLLMQITTSCSTYATSYGGPYYRKVGLFEYKLIKNKPAPKHAPPPGYYKHHKKTGTEAESK